MKNCVVYWCDDADVSVVFDFRVFSKRVAKILYPFIETDSPSESIWLIPTWEAFESASQ